MSSNHFTNIAIVGVHSSPHLYLAPNSILHRQAAISAASLPPRSSKPTSIPSQQSPEQAVNQSFLIV